MNLRLCLAALLLSSLALADADVQIEVLGIAQDAGYPQAGCYRPHCLRGWENPPLRRLASSIAVVDRTGKSKYLFDATPDMREQLYRLHLLAADGEFSLDGVFLTHAHIGHYTGLMFFGHESMGATKVPVYAMPRFAEFLSNNGPWDQLVRYRNIELRALRDQQPIALGKHLSVTPMQVPHRDEYSETVGFRIDGPNKSAVFIPDINKWSDWETSISDVVKSVDYALLDATFYADGEIPGRAMSEIPHPFVVETMALLDDLTDEQKSRVIFIHMNHTNPLLVDGSDAQQEVTRRGFRFAREGMHLDL